MPDSAMPAVVRCDACPVTCIIRPGLTGACDRYVNRDGQLERVDSHLVLDRAHGVDAGTASLQDGSADASPPSGPDDVFVTAIGAGTSYPEIKPAPFIVSSEIDGIDFVTVVTEGIFSYCGAKVKIDTDRHVGEECATVRVDGEPVGHVTTAEYGSAMLSLGGVRHLTGGSKREGRVTCRTIVDLCNGRPVTVTVDGGTEVTLQAGAPPVIDGRREERMRVGCGSATIGMFAPHWAGLIDEVVVVDDHITGVLSEHLAGRFLGVPPTGITVRGRRSTPGRYFETARPGQGWGGTDIEDPLTILGPFDRKAARPGLRMLMVCTTGENAAYYELDETLTPVRREIPKALLPTLEQLHLNCEPARTSVRFTAGAGGSMRAGIARNPIELTQSIHRGAIRMTCGGAPVDIWPGGGITFSVDVSRLPPGSFGSVPTPAIVAPIEFTMPRALYTSMGGDPGRIRSAASLYRSTRQPPHTGNPWPLRPL